MKPRRFNQAFSIIELLAVVTICAVLTGLLVPALSNIGNANSLAISGSQVADLAEFARQNSLTKNAQTALIVLTDTGLDDHHKVLLVYQLIMPADGQTPQSSDWTQIARAQVLGTGTIIDECTLANSAIQPTPGLPAMKYRDRTVSDYQYAIFMPGGNLQQNTTSRIRVAEGYFPKDATTPAYTRTQQDGKPVNYRDINILPGTGKVKIDLP